MTLVSPKTDRFLKVAKRDESNSRTPSAAHGKGTFWDHLWCYNRFCHHIGSARIPLSCGSSPTAGDASRWAYAQNGTAPSNSSSMSNIGSSLRWWLTWFVGSIAQLPTCRSKSVRASTYLPLAPTRTLALRCARSSGRIYKANNQVWEMCPSEMGHRDNFLLVGIEPRLHGSCV